jgi:putative SOS response-associated peptidase YedK
VSWSEVLAFSQPLTEQGGDNGPGEGSNDEIVIYRVGGPLPVIVWDAEARQRRVVPMRWGFPDPRDWRRPRPIHARSETVNAKEPFRKPFHGADLPVPMLACVMVTVPANELIRRAVKPQEEDPRMPAILEHDAWSTWLGEDNATPAAAKVMLN